MAILKNVVVRLFDRQWIDNGMDYCGPSIIALHLHSCDDSNEIMLDQVTL